MKVRVSPATMSYKDYERVRRNRQANRNLYNLKWGTCWLWIWVAIPIWIIKWTIKLIIKLFEVITKSFNNGGN